MHIVFHKDDTYILSFTRGEELLESLRDFCKKENISAGYFTGLGAADVLDIAYYNISDKKFERHQLKEEVEILSLVGNIALLDRETILHIHGVFGKKDLSVFGGHLFSTRISGACELHLTKCTDKMERSYDRETGLNLLCPATA